MRSLSDLNSGGGGGAAGGQGGQGCAECIKGIWANTPFWTRTLFISCTVIYLSGWISMYGIAYMACLPAEIVYKFQIWRLFTGLLVHP